MIKKILIAFAVLCAIPSVTFAQQVDPGADPVGFFATVYQWLKSGQYLMAFGAALVLLVWVFRTLLATKFDWFKTRLGGWCTSFGTSGVLAVGTAVMAGKSISLSLLSMALSAALVASGGWQALSDALEARKTKTAAAKPKVAVKKGK